MSELHVPEPPQRPAHLPGRPDAAEPTGDGAVDAALVELHAIDTGLPPAEQLPALVAVHEALQQRLSSTEG